MGGVFGGGVDFFPLFLELYDGLMIKTPANRRWIEAVARVLKSESFRSELAAISGYDLSLTGQVLYET